jgi:hypothetical protein
LEAKGSLGKEEVSRRGVDRRGRGRSAWKAEIGENSPGCQPAAAKGAEARLEWWEISESAQEVQ